MALINPHINFNGNAEEAFTFYKSVFGGEFAKVIRFKDLASHEFPVAKKEENKIMHIALPIGKTMLMANDVPEIMGRTNENENPELPGSEWDHTFSEQNGTTKVSVVIYNESLERMEKQIEMGFKEGFTMTLNYLEELLKTLSKK